MNPTNALVLTGVVVTVGRWSQGKQINMRVVVGVTFAAISLAAIDSADPDLARAFGTLILVVALLTYGLDIVEKTGLTK